jgi:hypothetical protein
MLPNALDCAVSPLIAVFIAPNNDIGSLRGVVGTLRGMKRAKNRGVIHTRILEAGIAPGQNRPGSSCRPDASASLVTTERIAQRFIEVG